MEGCNAQKSVGLEALAAVLDTLSGSQLDDALALVQVYQGRERVRLEIHHQYLVEEEWRRVKPLILKRAHDLMVQDVHMDRLGALGLACRLQTFQHVTSVTMSMLSEE